MELKHRDNISYAEDKAPTILEDMLDRILSMVNHAENNNSMLNENTEETKCILRKAMGIAESHEEGKSISGDALAEKEPSHLTFKLRRALDILSDRLDTNSSLIASQRKTINEFNSLI